MSEAPNLIHVKEMLGYTDTQWELWKSNPHNLVLIQNMSQVSQYKIIAEVIYSVGCAAGHKKGEKIYFSGGGALLCQESPNKICTMLLGPLTPLITGVFEKICSGADPTKIALNKVHCMDTGVENGGWGEVVVEVRVEKTEQL